SCRTRVLALKANGTARFRGSSTRRTAARRPATNAQVCVTGVRSMTIYVSFSLQSGARGAVKQRAAACWAMETGYQRGKIQTVSRAHAGRTLSKSLLAQRA